MSIVVTILHIIMCLILIGIVLLQTGKGASMGAAFGGGSNTLFGAAGPANFLNKVTTVAAVVFMLTSFVLAMISSRGAASKMSDVQPTQQEQPVEQTSTPVPPSEGQNIPAATDENVVPAASPVSEETSAAPAETVAPAVEPVSEETSTAPAETVAPAAEPGSEQTPEAGQPTGTPE